MSGDVLKVTYLINSLYPGGAEMGLEMLINNGFFADTDLNVVCLTRSNSDLEKRIAEKLPGKLSFLSDKDLSNKKIPLYIMRFFKYLKKENPAVVISSLSQSVLVSRFSKLFKKFKQITFEHNTDFQNKIAWHLIKRTDFLCDAFWCDSNSTKKALLKRNCPVNEKVLPLFYMSDRGFRKENYRISNQINLMAVGRLALQKNYTEAIEAVHRMKCSGIDVRLSIYGEGEQRQALTKKVEELKTNEIISLKGFVNDWVSEATKYDAYLLMSEFEGLSIATLEAMSVGMPCLVRPVGELENYIIDNQNGLFVNDSHDVENAVLRLMNEPYLAENLGRNAREYVIKNHSEDAFYRLYSEARRDLKVDKI